MHLSRRALVRLARAPRLSRSSVPLSACHISSQQPLVLVTRRAFADGGRRSGRKKKEDADDEHGQTSGSSTSSSDEKTSSDGAFKPGDLLVMLGGSAVAASFVVRGAAATNILRFAAGGPILAIGAVVSLYEIGGWQLVVAVPASVAAVVAAGHASDTWREGALREEVVSQVRQACPTAPEEVLVMLRTVPACEYETNKLHLKVFWQEDVADGQASTVSRPDAWRLQISAVRSSCLHPWVLTALRADTGSIDITSNEGTGRKLPPQTRHWKANSEEAMRWHTVWQQEVVAEQPALSVAPLAQVE